MQFEGPEKKLEIVVPRDAASLRARGEAFWREIVARAGATMISHASTDACDAWLLSESSLFVWDRRVLMITCGRTRLIDALLHLVDTFTPDGIEALVYERKNEYFPQLQRTSFDEDVERLRRILPGRAMRFGDPHGDHVALFHLDRPFRPEPDDTTLELLMYDIDPDASARFTGTADARALRDAIGVDALFPGWTVDDHCFTPMGYSLNALRGDRYATVHVTPQRVGSYVSFETNDVPDAGRVTEISRRILGFFRPGRCDAFAFDAPVALADLGAEFRAGAPRRDTLSCGYRVEYVHVDGPTHTPACDAERAPNESPQPTESPDGLDERHARTG